MKKLFLITLMIFLVTISYAENIDRAMIGCNTEKQLKKLISFVAEMDYDSYQKMLRSGECVGLQIGTEVKILDVGSWTSSGNTIKVKMKGREKPVWTLQEAVK